METIDISMTWEQYVCEVMRIYEHLTQEGKVEVWQKMIQIAKMADKFIEQQQEE